MGFSRRDLATASGTAAAVVHGFAAVAVLNKNVRHIGKGTVIIQMDLSNRRSFAAADMCA